MRIAFRLAAATLLAGSILAPVQAADVKIGAVNVTRVFGQAPQAEQARKKLEKEFGSSKRELEALQEDIIAKQEKLQRDGPVMGSGERAELERDIISDTKELRRRSEDFQEAFSRREKELFVALQSGVFKSIVDKAEKEGFDIIVGEGVIYASDQVDITEDLLKKLQDDFKKNK